MRRNVHGVLAGLLGATAILGSAPDGARAQTPKVYYACYVPSTGTVYRIKEPDTPQQCSSSNKKGAQVDHVEFSWTDGAGALFANSPAGGDLGGTLDAPTVAKLLGRAIGSGAPANGYVLTWDATANEWQAKPAPGGSGGTTDHGSLIGLTDDDHPQYLLADGVRGSTDGFAVVTATLHTGTIPVTGGGTRLMWYAGKGALRAGGVLDAQWNDANIGDWSVAMGWNSMATTFGSVGLGVASRATGHRAAALVGGWASNEQTFAVNGIASGMYSTAIGDQTKASGDRSMALGTAADTNDKLGAFVWGDGSTTNPVKALGTNQFVARAAHFWLGNSNNVTRTLGRYIETSTGAFLSSGGTWTNSSDVAKKTGFEDVDGEDVLEKLAAMPVSTWSYKEEDASVRHMGPTAQDFRAAFDLGSTDKAIATVDADGVSLAAIKALTARTRDLDARNRSLRADNAALMTRIDQLESSGRAMRAELDAVRQQLDQLAARLASLTASGDAGAGIEEATMYLITMNRPMSRPARRTCLIAGLLFAAACTEVPSPMEPVAPEPAFETPPACRRMRRAPLSGMPSIASSRACPKAPRRPA